MSLLLNSGDWDAGMRAGFADSAGLGKILSFMEKEWELGRSREVFGREVLSCQGFLADQGCVLQEFDPCCRLSRVQQLENG